MFFVRRVSEVIEFERAHQNVNRLTRGNLSLSLSLSLFLYLSLFISLYQAADCRDFFITLLQLLRLLLLLLFLPDEPVSRKD